MLLGLFILVGIPVLTRHDTGTGTKYGSDAANFNRTRPEEEPVELPESPSQSQKSRREEEEEEEG